MCLYSVSLTVAALEALRCCDDWRPTPGPDGGRVGIGFVQLQRQSSPDQRYSFWVQRRNGCGLRQAPGLP
jgi:hypothetical protein